jgi:MFS family permease
MATSTPSTECVSAGGSSLHLPRLTFQIKFARIPLTTAIAQMEAATTAAAFQLVDLMIVSSEGKLIAGLRSGVPWQLQLDIGEWTSKFLWWMVGAVMLGMGTALVYPTLLAAIGDVAHADWRASAVGIYRFWRDLGFAVGAILAGVVADFLGLTWAIAVIGVITFASGIVSAITMCETRKQIVQ